MSNVEKYRILSFLLTICETLNTSKHDEFYENSVNSYIVEQLSGRLVLHEYRLNADQRNSASTKTTPMIISHRSQSWMNAFSFTHIKSHAKIHSNLQFDLFIFYTILRKITLSYSMIPKNFNQTNTTDNETSTSASKRVTVARSSWIASARW